MTTAGCGSRRGIAVWLCAAFLLGAALPSWAQEKQKLTPEKRAELRKKLQDQLKQKPAEEKKPLSADEMKQLQDQLDKRVKTQLKDEEQKDRSASRERSDRFQKNGKLLQAAFRDVVSAANKCTVVVKCDGKETCLGSIVGGEGWILTKASELKGALTCKLADGRELPARKVGVHDDTDLAMLRVDVSGLPVLKWDSTGGKTVVGDWVASAGLGELPTAVGNVSVLPRKLIGRRGVLGIILEQADKGPKIVEVSPNSGAAKAGLKVNDVVLSVDGLRTKTREELVELVGTKYKPGDALKLVVQRGDKELAVEATLGKVPMDDRSAMQNTMGGRLSDRRTNFPQALQHDTILKPQECGGPLVNLDGAVVGINIARAGRVESYALPASVVVGLINELKSGRWAPYDEYEKQLAASLVALQTTEQAVQQAKGDLDRIINEAQSALKKVETARAAAAKAVNEAKNALEQARAAQRAASK